MILLFGAGGQLGLEISRYALRHDIALKGFSRTQVDITDRDRVAGAVEQFKPRMVINAAAYTDVDKAESDFDAALAANSLGPGIVAEICRVASIPLLHFSTDYVFDGTKAGPYVESDPVNPASAYGRSKAIGEDKIRAAHPEHIILRTAWVYGEFGRNFLKTMLRLAAERTEIRVVSDQRGSPTSTLQIAKAAFSIVPGMLDGACRWGTYHLAGEGITTWFDFASAIVSTQARYTQKTPSVIPITTSEYPTAARRPSNSSLDCGLIRQTFGIEPVPWRSECERVIDAIMRS